MPAHDSGILVPVWLMGISSRIDLMAHTKYLRVARLMSFALLARSFWSCQLSRSM